MKHKLIYFMILVSLISLNFVSAESDLVFKQDEIVNYSFTCLDTSYSYCNSSTTCYISISSPNGTSLVNNQTLTYLATSFNYILPTTTLGVYDWILICNGLSNARSEGDYEVTNSGFVTDITRGIISIMLLIILTFFFVLALVGLFKIEDYKGKFALYWVCHVLLVGITFIAWNLALGSLVSDSAIAGIFKVLFYFSTLAVIPMIMLSIAWIVYIHTFNEHFQKLIDKGEDTETAFAMANKKRGGWFYGKR